MAVAYVTGGHELHGGSGAETVFTSFNPGSGATLGIIMFAADGSDATTGVTWNGSAMTQAKQASSSGGGYVGMDSYWIANPTTGDIVVTATTRGAVAVVTFSGADTTTPFGTWVEPGVAVSSSQTTGTITGVDSSGMFIGWVNWYHGDVPGTITWNADQTERVVDTYPTAVTIGVVTKAGGASTTIGGEAANASRTQFLAAYINAAAASAIEITSGVGALTASGKNPALDYGMPLSTGAVTAAGHDPALIERSTRYAYPSADLDAGPWTPSTGTALYAMIDESVADDGDYIVTNTAGVAKITLMPVSDPAASSGHVVNYRIWSPVGGNATVRLVQGASTVIASWDHTGLPTSPTNFSQGLSAAEADSITNYDDLHIEFEAT